MNIKPAQRLNITSEYYFSNKLKEIALMIKNGLPVINLGIGSPDLAPPPKAIEALHKYSKEPESHRYPPYTGVPALRIALAEWYKNYFKVALNPENEILPLLGSKEGIMHISLAFLNPGDEVLVPNPGYPAYSAVAKIVGADVKEYDLLSSNNWYPDIEKLENGDLSKVKLMWVNYPNMPTGAGSTTEVFEKLIAFGKRHNILICNDNPYCFILNEHPLSILSVDGAKEIALELNSLSKSHNMPGFRVGMVAGDEILIKYILQIKSNIDSGMYLPVQYAAVEALKEDTLWYKKNNLIYLERRKLAEEILNTLHCKFEINQVGMFVWASIPETYKDSKELSDFLLKKANVFITPGFIFGSNGNSYIRVSLCSNEKTLSEALKRIKSL